MGLNSFVQRVKALKIFLGNFKFRIVLTPWSFYNPAESGLFYNDLWQLLKGNTLTHQSNMGKFTLSKNIGGTKFLLTGQNIA